MGERFGNYEILRKLAAGGMAEVLLAKQKSIGGFERLVCLKRILPHLGGQEEFMKMFQDEARIAANLVHPNIAQIYDISEENGQFYIAMEYVRGEDLRRIYNQEVGRGQCIGFGPAAQIISGAAAALDYAHRHADLNGAPLGIVHRDVSPQNVLVTFDGHVKLIDFGVAKAAGKLNQTRAGVLKGKYSYMSPEQASGDPVDSRTDIFALGITLYEITCGTRLFKRDNELETLHAVVACNVPPPSQVKAGYDEELERIVLKSLAAEPERRYQSAGEMGHELDAYLHRHGHPASASHLAHYMQDLFAEKLADEPHFGGYADAGPPGRPEAPPRSLATVSTPADKRVTSEAPATGEPNDEAGRAPDAPGAQSESSAEADAPRAAAAPAPSSDEATTVDVPKAAPSPFARLTPETTPEEWRVRPVREVTAAASSLAPVTEAGESPTRLDLPELRPTQPASGSRSRSRRAGPRPLKPAQRWASLALAVAVVAGGGWWLARPPGAGLPPEPPPQTGPAAAAAGAPPRVASSSDPVPPAYGDAAAPARAAPPQSADVEAKGTQKPLRPGRPGQAALDIEAPLPMAVSFGGQYLGETPLAGVPMAAGSFRFKLENKREGVVTWRRIQLARGQRASMVVADRRGHVHIRGVPWVWVQRGLYPATESPVEADWLEGEYALTLECPDGRRTAHTLLVEADRHSGIVIDCVAGVVRHEHTTNSVPGL